MRGDAQMSVDLINSLETKWRYVSGVLSFHPDDKVTPEQEQRTIEDFEKLAFAGLPPDSFNILWVRHTHAGKHELHFVIPRVELSTGKALNPFYPGWQYHFRAFRDLCNYREGWARPEDPKRARVSTPEHAKVPTERIELWGKATNAKERTEAKEKITAYLQTLIGKGVIQNRDHVVNALKEVGLEVARQGEDYISIKNPDGGKNLRLKGGIYAKQFELNIAKDGGPDRGSNGGQRQDNSELLRKIEREFAKYVSDRSDYNQRTYQNPTLERGTGNLKNLPELTAGRENYGPKPAPDNRPHVQPAPAQTFLGVHGHDSGSGLHQPGIDSGQPLPLQEHGNGHDGALGKGTGQGGISGGTTSKTFSKIQHSGGLQRGRQGLSGLVKGMENQGNSGTKRQDFVGNRQEVTHERDKSNLEKITIRNEGGIGPAAEQTGSRNQSIAGRSAQLEQSVTAYERCIHAFAEFLGRVEQQIRLITEKFVNAQREKARQLQLERSRSRGMEL